MPIVCEQVHCAGVHDGSERLKYIVNGGCGDLQQLDVRRIVHDGVVAVKFMHGTGSVCVCSLSLQRVCHMLSGNTQFM